MKENIDSDLKLEQDEIEIITALLLKDENMNIHHISEISPSLEDVFLYLVEKKTSDDE